VNGNFDKPESYAVFRVRKKGLNPARIVNYFANTRIGEVFSGELRRAERQLSLTEIRQKVT